MLDADSRRTVASAPDVVVYGDTEDPLRFYAFAVTPRLAVDDAGRPQISLFAYRHGKDRPPEGGQLALTTTLGITDAERAALALALAPPPEPGATQVVPPQPVPAIVAPQWLSGEVTVQFGEGVELTGTPDLGAANTCSLATMLDGPAARLVEERIAGGLHEVTAAYVVEIAAAHRAETTAERTDTDGGGTSAFRLLVDVTAAERLRLELRGPLHLAPASGTPPAPFTTEIVL